MEKPGKYILTPESGAETGARASGTGTVQPLQPPATRAERWSVRRLLDVIGQPPVTLVLWDGSDFPPQRATSVADIIIRDRRALRRLLVNPEYEFGERYRSGRIEDVGGLCDCLEAIYRALRTDKNRGRLARETGKKAREKAA